MENFKHRDLVAAEDIGKVGVLVMLECRESRRGGLNPEGSGETGVRERVFSWRELGGMGWLSSHLKPSEVASGRPVREVVGWTLWLVSKDPKGSLVAAEEGAVGGGNCTRT